MGSHEASTSTGLLLNNELSAFTSRLPERYLGHAGVSLTSRGPGSGRCRHWLPRYCWTLPKGVSSLRSQHPKTSSCRSTPHWRPCGNYGAGATACSRYRTTSPMLPPSSSMKTTFVYAAVNNRVGGYFDGN
ncbi:hypothetical protein MTO96_026707 [Rhipicephalus appendiculatus]